MQEIKYILLLPKYSLKWQWSISVPTNTFFLTAETKLVKRLGKKQGISDKLQQYLQKSEGFKD